MDDLLNVFVLNPFFVIIFSVIILLEWIIPCLYLASFKNIKGHEMAHASAAINNNFQALIVYPKVKDVKAQYYTVGDTGLREYYVTKEFYKDILGLKSAAVCFYNCIPNEYNEVHKKITKAGAFYSVNKALFVYLIMAGIKVPICAFFYYIFYVSIAQIIKVYGCFLLIDILFALCFIWIYAGSRPCQLSGFKKEIAKAQRENRKIRYSVSDGTKLRKQKKYADILKDIELERLRTFDDIEELLKNIPRIHKMVEE